MKVLKMKVSYKDANGNNKEVITTREQDKDLIESDFNDLMYHKFIFKSSWVKRTTERTNYNGTRTIKFKCDNDAMYEFVMEVK